MGIYGRRSLLTLRPLRRLLQALTTQPQQVQPAVAVAQTPAQAAAAWAAQNAEWGHGGAAAAAAAGAATAAAAAPAPAPASAWNEWAPFPTNGAAGATGASTSASSASAPQCTAYFRQISFLSTLTLTASLSGVNSSWGLSEGACAAQYITATSPVDVHVYNADLYPGLNPSTFVPMEWCNSWPLHFNTPSAQPEIIVRGDGDPYSAAGAITECTWNFATPTKERRGDESVVLAGVRCVALALR
jgi:hypothetical protein